MLFNVLLEIEAPTPADVREIPHIVNVPLKPPASELAELRLLIEQLFIATGVAPECDIPHIKPPPVPRSVIFLIVLLE
jgi:hypothetical protein